jgi:hypothetical protein
LEAERTRILEESKTEEEDNRKQLMALVVALDEQSFQFQTEIQELKQSMDAKEQEYERSLAKCVQQIATIQAKRDRVEEQRRQKIGEIQGEIDEIEADFRQKMREAARVAERLKGSLITVKARKSKELEAEQQRSTDQQRLLRENGELRVRICELENALEVEKDKFAVLRRELSATLGPRRTASLFI